MKLDEKLAGQLFAAALGGKPPSRWQKVRHLVRYRRRLRPYTHTFTRVDI